MKLIIEPVVPQPRRNKDATWSWDHPGVGGFGGLSYEELKRMLRHLAPHHRGDELHGDVVERVEARQAKDITFSEWGPDLAEEWLGDNQRTDWSLEGWFWLYHLKEDT